jgi:hypothetical protein
MHGSNAQEEKHPRGVFTTRYKVQRWGVRALLAIDSTGTCIKAIPLRPEVNEERATIALREWLDRVDLVPQLVREERKLPQPPHPCQRDDHLSFALRTTRRNVDRLRRSDHQD